MTFKELMSVFTVNGCREIYIKPLSTNDDSQHGVYLGGSFDLLNIFPVSKIKTEPAGSWERERFKAAMNFSWIAEDGDIYAAPYSQLILYPKYPEVRLSGFLKGCRNAPSKLMRANKANRLLFLSVSHDKRILGYVTSPWSDLAKDCKRQLRKVDRQGVFRIISLADEVDSRKKLISKLRKITKLGWIQSKRLNNLGVLLPCDSSNCGGYTLEAQLGIRPNSNAEPDFLGWEIKQFGVEDFSLAGSAVITLMTPEPTGGYYRKYGAGEFLRKYGYPDKLGRPDRVNFGGIHRYGERHDTTGLILRLKGFDEKKGKIRKTNGMITLVDAKGKDAASWSFVNLLEHWTRKHNKACYVPSIRSAGKQRRYKYGSKIILGTGADFELFLQQMAEGHIYYDPGIKIETISGRTKVKTRNQFRIKSGHLENLYGNHEIVDLTRKIK